MKSNYKQLGQFIRQVDVRNTDGKEDNLLGVSVQKKFIPSIANTVGTDFTKYKVVKKGQFTYIPDTSRRGDKIGIALLEDYDEGLVSNVYTVFEVVDAHKLIPEYLMLWFSRPEFDRYARYKSHGSVREVLDWDEMCKVELPVPSYAEQLEIVREYRTISERIELKQKINDNLTAYGIASLHEHIGVAALMNATQSELDAINIPNGWNLQTVSEYCIETKSGATPSRANNEYWLNGNIPWLKSGEVHNGVILKTEECITQVAVDNSSTKLLPPDTVLMAMYGVTAGEVGYLSIPSTTNQAVCGMVCSSKEAAAYLFFSLLQNQDTASRLSNGGAQDNLSKNFIDNILIVVPDSKTLADLKLHNLIAQISLNTKEIQILLETQATILTRLSSR